MAMAVLLAIDMGADLPGDLVGGGVALLPGLGVAHLPGHLPLVGLGHLVALSLHMLLADGASGVTSVTGLSRPLAIVSSIAVTSSNNLSVVTNNSGAVVDLGVGLGALGGEGVLALLDIGGVHNSLAHGPGDLAGVLLGDLVTLLLHMLLALGAGAVSMVTSLGISLSLSLAVTSVSVSLVTSIGLDIDNLGVVSDHMGGLADLGVDLLAVLGDNVLALLNVGRVDHNVVLLVTLLPLLLDGLLVTLPVHLLLTVGTRGVASVSGLSLSLGLGNGAGESGSSQEEGGANLVHHLAGNN